MHGLVGHVRSFSFILRAENCTPGELEAENGRTRCTFVKDLTALWRAEVRFRFRCGEPSYVIIVVS